MKKDYPVQRSEQEWKEKLSEEQYRVLRQQGTEAPHSGRYNLHFDQGEYKCAACGNKLFEDDQKFESNCGWPSFDDAIEGSIEYVQDKSFGMIRTEILCANCGSHLGHVFDDGPTDTGQRYCVNSASIDFEPKNNKS
ncbi:peptide-methionine (R)-S-oxide reductase [Salinimicrobium marinum]|uniref:peptide-methionine (R)-S-oxide reductase n=1 Tax=Salinimicrobium marinum TaxID=680283 RepID=A0A918SDC5_9FLAO|nr:peptide-methionine (R)-S-oxide reductase MsrB [Salinimicrobium marinum]GHA33160.1 peptide-methionine (R)-S-oxide reductase [Salinimicrobium marinum]